MSLDQSGYNKGGMIAFVFSMAITSVFFIYVAFFSGGVDLKEVSPEQGAAQTVAGAAEAPKAVDISNVQEPWMPSEDMIAAGHQLYKTNCAMCHGNEGKGDGPAGASLNPHPRNLVEGKWKFGGGRLGLMKVLHDGIPGTSMQAYAHMPVNQRWAIVHYINSITENKVADNDAEVAAKAPSFAK